MARAVHLGEAVLGEAVNKRRDHDVSCPHFLFWVVSPRFGIADHQLQGLLCPMKKTTGVTELEAGVLEKCLKCHGDT